MTISAYTGLPGSGKSYTVVKNVILPALKSGRVIYTNIPLDETLILEKFGYTPIQITVDQIIADENFWVNSIEGGSLVVIDEVARLWKAGLKANNARDVDAVFLQEHRHMTKDGKSLEIVLVCQDLNQISMFVRTLVDRTFITSKLSAVGQSNRYRLATYSGAQTRQQLKEADFLSAELGKYTKDIYQYYNSHSRGDGAGDETTVDGSFGVFKRWHFILFGSVILAACYLMYYFVFNVAAPVFLAEPEEVAMETVSGPLQNDYEEPQGADFISSMGDVVIVNNNSILGFRFNVEIAGGYTIMDVSHLSAFGVTVTAINDCLVSFADSNGEAFRFATCQSVDEKGGFLGNVPEII